MAEKRLPEIDAVEVIYAALLPLNAELRKKVLKSVYALLDTSEPEQASQEALRQESDAVVVAGTQKPPVHHAGWPVSIVELMRDKQPGTNAQRIALFAYYREKHEGVPRFGREDLEPISPRRRSRSPTNYDRDFVEAVKKGWIHEDSHESYITSRGIETVEAGFAGERKYTKGGRAARQSADKVRKPSKSRRLKKNKE